MLKAIFYRGDIRQATVARALERYREAIGINGTLPMAFLVGRSQAINLVQSLSDLGLDIPVVIHRPAGRNQLWMRVKPEGCSIFRPGEELLSTKLLPVMHQLWEQTDGARAMIINYHYKSILLQLAIRGEEVSLPIYLSSDINRGEMGVVISDETNWIDLVLLDLSLEISFHELMVGGEESDELAELV